MKYLWQDLCYGCCSINGHHRMLGGICQKASDCMLLPQEQPCKLCRIHTASQDAIESAWFLSFRNQNNYCFNTNTVFCFQQDLLKNKRSSKIEIKGDTWHLSNVTYFFRAPSMLSTALSFSFPRMKTAYFSQSKYSKSKQEEGLVKQMLDIGKGSIMHQWIQFID